MSVFMFFVYLNLGWVIWTTDCQRFIPVHSYDSLFSYLASGTEIRYIFNVSSCVDPDNPPQYKDIPTFGGKINHFDASPNSGDKPGQSSFNDAQFIHGKTYNIDKELYTFWIENDTAKVFWAKPGLFENDTSTLSGLYCSWMQGRGKFWAKPHSRKRQLTSAKEVKDTLFSGGEVNYLVNKTQCKCLETSDQFMDGIAGDTVKSFKLTKDGSIEFSSDSTTVFPIAWTYIRVITVVNVHSNNTVTFSTSRFDTVTLEESTNDMLICPIHTASSPQGVKFFVNVN